jgi:tetratricopeptide (TPR) repeat protein
MAAEGRDFGQIITFYSYKGGTGRSMVLANVAYILSMQNGSRTNGGKPVLAIDWDLEAPGLHRYFQSDLPSPAEQRPGLIDFFVSVEEFYRQRAPAGELGEDRAETEEATGLFRDALQKFPLDEHLFRLSSIPGLSLMTAGKLDDGYVQRVRKFPWESFYLRYGSFLTHLRELLMKRFGHVLIDSRTGITDTSQICTRVMPEKMVAVFAPNQQNLEGVTDVIRRAANFRGRSGDVRGWIAFPVASRLDASASRLRELWWHGARDQDAPVGYQPIFEALFKDLYSLDECSLEHFFAATQIPHDSDYAYGETIAARVGGVTDRLSIGHACANLAARVTKLDAPWDPLPEESVAVAQQNEREARRDAAASLRQRRRLARTSIVAGVALLAALGVVAVRYRNTSKVNRAADLVKAGQALASEGDFKAAHLRYDQALALLPSADAYWKRGQLRASEQDHKGALDDYRQAIAIDRNLVGAYFDRAELLRETHDRAGAESDYNKVVALNKEFAAAHFRLALLRLLRHDEKGAMAAVEDARRYGKLDATADKLRDQAIWTLSAEITAQPQSARLQLDRARLQWMQGRWLNAAADFQRYLESNSGDSEAAEAKAKIAESFLRVPPDEEGGTLGRPALAVAIAELGHKYGPSEKKAASTRYMGSVPPENGRWPASFVFWCFEEAAHEEHLPTNGFFSRPASVAALIDQVRRRGMYRAPNYQPRPGDLVFSADPHQKQVGIVHHFRDGRVYSIEQDLTDNLSLSGYVRSTSDLAGFAQITNGALVVVVPPPSLPDAGVNGIVDSLTKEEMAAQINLPKSDRFPDSTTVRYFRYPADSAEAQRILDLIQTAGGVQGGRISYVVDKTLHLSSYTRYFEIRLSKTAFGDGPVATSKLIRVQVSNPPEGLTVLIDGRPGRLPIRLPRDGRSHTLRFESARTRPEIKTVTADQDLSLELVNKPRLLID